MALLWRRHLAVHETGLLAPQKRRLAARRSYVESGGQQPLPRKILRLLLPAAYCPYVAAAEWRLLLRTNLQAPLPGAHCSCVEPAEQRLLLRQTLQAHCLAEEQEGQQFLLRLALQLKQAHHAR